MKRFLFSACIVLSLIFTLVLFFPSVEAAMYETPGTVTLYVGWPTYEKVYSFDIEEGYTWQDLATEGASLGTEECAIMTLDDIVFLRLPNYEGSLKVMTSDGVLQKPEDVISAASYVVGDLVEFALEGYANGEPTGFTYTFSFIGANYTFADLAKQGVRVNSSDFGVCKFYMLTDTEFVLRVGIGINGAFEYQFALAYSDTGALVKPTDVFRSISYRGLDACQAFGSHFYLDTFWVQEPTCTQSGSGWIECRYCSHKELREYEALGHNVDDEGYCKREGCNYVDPSKFLENVGSDIVEGAKSWWDRLTKSKLVQGSKDALDNALGGFIDWVVNKANSALAFVAVVSASAFIVIVFFVVKRIVRKLKK